MLYPRVVASIVALVHSVGLEVVAEGIEDEETLDAMRSLDCDHVQGYPLGRPLPPDELMISLSGRNLDRTAA